MARDNKEVMMTHTNPGAGLNEPLDALRAMQVDDHEAADGQVVPGLFIHRDPASEVNLRWSSPRGRILDVQTKIDLPGAWLGLHLSLPLTDISGVGFIGFAARTAAAQPVTIRACLRSGVEGGTFHDCFFDRYILAQPEESDYMAMIAPDRRPLLPVKAAWREFILFLPPTHGVHLALIDLRFFVV